MAKFLRDIRLSNIKINEELLIQLSEVFSARASLLKSNEGIQENEENKIFLTFILRFDDKGYRFFTAPELIQYFRRAKEIERLIITVETGISLRSNRAVGDHLELRLDKIDNNNNLLSVTSDDSDWVDSSFSAVQEVLTKCKTRNGWARSAWSALGIQILGVVGGFGLSLWAASKISQKLTIENAFIITFLFAFLIFSNVWGYINNLILKYFYKIFPSIQFYRPDKDKINWLMQAIIGGIAAAFAFYLLGQLFAYIGDFLATLKIK